MKRNIYKFEFREKGKAARSPVPALADETTATPPIVWMLAFAHRVEKEISGGIFHNRAAAAKHYGITRARLTQIMNLLWLAPGIQKDIIRGECNQSSSERAMRSASSLPIWNTDFE